MVITRNMTSNIERRGTTDDQVDTREKLRKLQQRMNEM